MNREADISIVIPAFNAGRFLRATLESVTSQSDLMTEIVVVDDGSTDDTVAIARGFGERLQLIEGTHKGAQAARNAGLNATSAPFVKFLDADDVLLPGSLRRQVTQAKALDPRAIPYGPARTMDANGNIGTVLPHTPPRPGLHPVAHILFNSPLTSCPLHRRELLSEVGGMDESLPREHENDLHFRLVLNGVRMVYDAKPVYAYRRHSRHAGLMSGGASRFGARWMLDYLKLQERRIEQHFGWPTPKDVRRHLAMLYWRCGRSILREGRTDVALEYFSEARRIFPPDPVCGRGVYRALNRILGPIRAERWLARARGPRGAALATESHQST